MHYGTSLVVICDLLKRRDFAVLFHLMVDCVLRVAIPFKFIKITTQLIYRFIIYLI